MKTIIKFSATWCNPCKSYAPIFDKVTKDLTNEIKVQSLDVEKNPDIAGKYGVMSIPITIIIDEKGVKVDDLVGVIKEEDLKDFINKNK